MELIVEHNRRLHMGGVVLGVMLMGGGVLGMSAFTASDTASEWLEAVTLAVFGLGLLVPNLRRLFKSGPALVVDNRGLRYCLGSRPLSLAWSEIERINVTTLFGDSVLKIVPRDQSVIERNCGPVVRLLHFLLRPQITTPLALYLPESLVREPLAVVVEAISQHGFAVSEGEGDGEPLASSPNSSSPRSIRALAVFFLCILVAALGQAVSFPGVLGPRSSIGFYVSVSEVTNSFWYWGTFWICRFSEGQTAEADGVRDKRRLGEAPPAIDTIKETLKRNRIIYASYWIPVFAFFALEAFMPRLGLRRVGMVSAVDLFLLVVGVVIGLQLKKRMVTLVAQNGTRAAFGVLGIDAENEAIDRRLRFGLLSRILVIAFVLVGVLLGTAPMPVS